jgi:hypothetical protein
MISSAKEGARGKGNRYKAAFQQTCFWAVETSKKTEKKACLAVRFPA